MVALVVACSAAPEPSTKAVEVTAGATDDRTTDSAAATGDAAATTNDTTDDAPANTDQPPTSDGETTQTATVVAESASGGATPATTVASSKPTTTVRAGGPTTTARVTTTTRPKPTTTPPPTTPAPTPPPTPAPTPAPTAPPRTIGACQQLSLDTVNGWRATLGKPALSPSSSLYNGACSWATHLAETDSFSHAPGVSGEVLALNSGNCSTALAMWQGSSSHYAVLTSSIPSVGAIACVKDSNGEFWAVGRVA